MTAPFSIRQIAASDAPQATTYAQCVEVAGAKRFLFISGQIPQMADGRVPDSFYEQAQAVWGNVIAQLRAGDMDLDNLVKVTIFLADRRYINDYRKARDAALGGRRIGLTTIITGIFDEGWLLEIEAIAAA